MPDARSHELLGDIMAAFTSADFDQIPHLVQKGIDSGLEPLLAGQPAQQAKGKVVIGTVKGDIHSLGKNIVITLLKTAGHEVFDLGVDVPASKFVAKAAETHTDIIAVCALMTTNMPQQKEVIEYLFTANKREDCFVMIGGDCTTKEWASQIKADTYGATAADAVALADDYVQRRKRS